MTDTQRPAGGLIVQRGQLLGRLAVGDAVLAEVDAARRARTMRNHTGTHILHRALRNVVGEGARQAGSLVTPDGLRFDFPLDRGLTDDERLRIEDEARRVIREDRPVTAARMSMREAIDAGADAFFDEKYGETVRTIRVEGYSHELCGGTHCRASGQIGGFVITSERSIGSGMRRIEALTGDGADAWVTARLDLLQRAGSVAGATSIESLPERLTALQEELKDARRRARAGAGKAIPKASELAAAAESRRPGRRRRHIRRPVRVDRDDEGSRPGRARPAAQRRDRPGARCRRAPDLRDRLAGPRRAGPRCGQPRPARRGPLRRAGRGTAGDGPGQGHHGGTGSAAALGGGPRTVRETARAGAAG